eukprot:m.119879 g.119879  ORF g.119879 m.119879 type:complete len:432 (+) comp28772_c0_seq1:148-1443(+)
MISSSEDDEPSTTVEKTEKETKSTPAVVSDDDAEDKADPVDDAPVAAGDDVDDIGDISDSDDDKEVPLTSQDDDNATFDPDGKHKKRDLTARVFDDDDDDDVDGGGTFEDNLLEEEHIDGTRKISMTEYDLGDGLALVKMPNFLSIDERPFNPDTYTEVGADSESVNRDELGRKRVKLKAENTIRWRYAVDADGKNILLDNGEFKKESNANIVKWSDGTESLVIGDQLVQYKRDDNKEKHSGIYTIEKAVYADEEEEAGDAMIAVATLDQKVHLQLYSTKSKMHEEVTRNVAISAGKKQKIKEITTDENPHTILARKKKDFADAQRREMNKMAKMVSKQRAARSKSDRGGGRLSKSYLEGGIDEEEDDYYSSEEEMDTENRKRTVDSEDDEEENVAEEEEEEDEPAAKEEDEKVAAPKKKRRVVADSDDSE